MQYLLDNTVRQQKKERDLLVGRYSMVRAAEQTLSEHLSSSLIKVIVGPRRVGKSTLAMQCLKGLNFGYLNFEDNTLPHDLDTDALMSVIDTVYDTPHILLFDEIQVLPRWEQFLNTLHRRGRNIVITGSNSRLLSGELASSLTGRHIPIELLPLSLKEFSNHPHYIRSTPTDNLHVLDSKIFDKYWMTGGFPEVSIGNEEQQGYLTTLLDSIILKDIVQRYQLRKPQAVAMLLNLLIEEPCARFSANNVSKALPKPGISVTTILKYLTMAKEAYLLFELQPFHAKPRERMKADRKLYVIDHALSRVRNSGFSEKRGAVLENLIFIELVRRGFIPNEKLFYLETTLGKEVDFLIKHSRSEIELIQVCYEMASIKTLSRELDAITEAARITGSKKL